MDELVAKLENLYDDEANNVKDQLQKKMIYRYGKRAAMPYRFGKRAAMPYRFGKRLAMPYRFGKRLAMPYRFGKRGSDIDDEYETELDDKQKRLTYRYGK